MKTTKLLLITAALSLSACGYSARDVETVGQVKRIVHNTPIFCGNYTDADISLGVIRGGVGSMSKQDILVNINKKQEQILKLANQNGAIIKITYDRQRFNWCTGGRWATDVEILK